MVFGNNVGVAQYVVPNPMSAEYVLDKDGKRHRRTRANTGPRKFIVTDHDIKPGNPLYADLITKWAKYHVTVQDAQAAIIGFLAEHGPLSMVVYSGNVSLQAWWYCQGEKETLSSGLRAFFGKAQKSKSSRFRGGIPKAQRAKQAKAGAGGNSQHPEFAQDQPVSFRSSARIVTCHTCLTGASLTG
jgi:hypothetical protein